MERGGAWALRDAIARFYGAVRCLQQGDPLPMHALWAHEAGVTLLPPRGALREGWADIGAYWEQAARVAAASPATVQVSVPAVSVRLHGAFAYTCSVENVSVTREEHVAAFSARATHIYRQEGGDWLLLHRHTDALGQT